MREGLQRTDIDGFLIDWFRVERPTPHWLECEKTMWQELLGEKFPACGWADHSAEVWKTLDPERFGFYGFCFVNPGTGLPWTMDDIENYRRKVSAPACIERLQADARNIEIMRTAYSQIGR